MNTPADSPTPQPPLSPRPPVPVLVGRAREAIDDEQETQHQYHNSLRESFFMER